MVVTLSGEDNFVPGGWRGGNGPCWGGLERIEILIKDQESK